MKAQNLTISIPTNGCKKNCPYCVSRMTGYIEHNPFLFLRNIPKVLKMASLSEVSSILFSSKGEIFDSDFGIESLYNVIARVGGSHLPLEIQSNGSIIPYLNNLRYEKKEVNESILYTIADNINIIAHSIDSEQDLNKLAVFISAHGNKFVHRATVNVTADIAKMGVRKVIERIRCIGFRQLTVRKLSIPENGIVSNNSSHATAMWISNNNENPLVKDFLREFEDIVEHEGRFLRGLPYGTLYDVEGLSVTYYDRCIQEESENSEDIRSLIYLEDGHLYTTWNSPASLIF